MSRHPDIGCRSAMISRAADDLRHEPAVAAVLSGRFEDAAVGRARWSWAASMSRFSRPFAAIVMAKPFCNWRAILALQAGRDDPQ